MSSRQEARDAEPGTVGTTASAQLRIRLYVVTGQVHSTKAAHNLESALKASGVGYDLEILDVFEDADRARTDEVLVAPTVIRLNPLPRRRLTGALQDRDAICRVLGLPFPARETH